MLFSLILGFEPSFCLLLAFFFTFLVIARGWTEPPPTAPPVPAYPWPILGHLPYLRGDPRGKMLEWNRKLGDIYTIYRGLTLNVVIGSYDLLKEIIAGQAEFSSDKYCPGNGYAVPHDAGILSTPGFPWKENCSTPLSVLKSFGMSENVIEEKITEEVSAYLSEIASSDGKPTEVGTITFRAVSNIVCSFLLGKRFDYSDGHFNKLLDLTQTCIEHQRRHCVRNAFPGVRYLPFDWFKAKEMWRLDKQYLELVDEFIVELNAEEKTSDSIISAYLESMKQGQACEKETELSLSHLKCMVRDLILEESETTTSTILWFYLYLIRYPEVQRKVYEEMVREIGTSRALTAADRPHLNYLSATIMEVQRITSINPVGVPHRCTEDVTIRGYVIPKDTTVLLHLDAVLLEDDIWGDAGLFRPERFLDDHGELLNPEELAVLSLGRRVCLGETLANTQLFLLIGSVVQRFEALPRNPERRLPPIKDRPNGISCPPQPYVLRLVERQGNYLKS